MLLFELIFIYLYKISYQLFIIIKIFYESIVLMFCLVIILMKIFGLIDLLLVAMIEYYYQI